MSLWLFKITFNQKTNQLFELQFSSNLENMVYVTVQAKTGLVRTYWYFEKYQDEKILFSYNYIAFTHTRPFLFSISWDLFSTSVE